MKLVFPPGSIDPHMGSIVKGLYSTELMTEDTDDPGRTTMSIDVGGRSLSSTTLKCDSSFSSRLTHLLFNVNRPIVIHCHQSFVADRKPEKNMRRVI